MQLLLTLGAFIETPLGQAIILAIPTFVQDVIGIWHKEGKITTVEIAEYLADQKTFDELVPKKVTP